MRWFPQKFNDSFAILVFLSLLAFTGWLLQQQVEKDVVLLLLGAEIAWIGNIVQFFYRKAPTEPDPPPEPREPPRG